MADLLGEIFAIRARNNRYHVALIKLALEADPKRAKALLRRIAENDEAIMLRTKALAQ
jgi:hypothetical protein